MELVGSAVWIYTFHARQIYVPAAQLAGVNAIARATLLASVSASSLVFLPLGEAAGIQAVLMVQGAVLLVASAMWWRDKRLAGMRLSAARAPAGGHGGGDRDAPELAPAAHRAG
jgi:hypothetical protein